MLVGELLCSLCAPGIDEAVIPIKGLHAAGVGDVRHSGRLVAVASSSTEMIYTVEFRLLETFEYGLCSYLYCLLGIDVVHR